MAHHVDPAKATLLNLREGPKPAAAIIALPQGTMVTKMAEHPRQADWWQVTAHISGNNVDGFVKSGFLAPGAPAIIPPVVLPAIPEVHLDRRGNRRSESGGRARLLDEAAMPARGSGTAAQKAQDILNIISYLDPERSAHRRYKATGGKTFSNIYAYDYAYLCGVYLPRVWWRSKSLVSIASGNVPPVSYGQTVLEMDANSLHDWFEEFGAGFGWRQLFSVGDLQSAANAGEAAIIVAKRANLASSGHIVAVVPEHGGVCAAVSGGKVVRPVESQAGIVNFRAKVKSKRWWQATDRFQSFGLWTHV
ncbi:MAG: SH3 domain-containing protein [Pseudomonadota bacterium]